MGRSSYDRHRYFYISLFRKLWLSLLLERLVVLDKLRYTLSVGLRKLEAFFGALITTMSVTFGYLVSCCVKKKNFNYLLTCVSTLQADRINWKS